jgi:hypothetical protein
MEGLENLTEEEKDFLLEVPVLITILVAGSTPGHHLNNKEKAWAEKLLEFRAMRNHDAFLADYYLHVEFRWKDLFSKYSHMLIDEAELDVRCQYISKELARLNEILPKLPPHEGRELYLSLKSFAKQIALADGGFIGYGGITPEENHWIKLEMVQNPVA